MNFRDFSCSDDLNQEMEIVVRFRDFDVLQFNLRTSERKGDDKLMFWIQQEIVLKKKKICPVIDPETSLKSGRLKQSFSTFIRWQPTEKKRHNLETQRDLMYFLISAKQHTL